MKFLAMAAGLLVAATTAVASLAPAVPQSPEELTTRFDRAKQEADDRIAAIIAIPDGARTFANTIGRDR